MTGPRLDDADLWEVLHQHGLTPEEATFHVERRKHAERRQMGNPEDVVGEISPLEAAGIGGFQGATSEFGDELSSIGNKDPQAMRDAARATIEASRKQHPYITGGAELAGSFANPVLRLLGGAAQSARFVNPAATGAVIGAGAGGLAGAGAGEGSAEDRAPNAILGTILGGATGAGVGALGGKASKFFARAPKAASKAVTGASGPVQRGMSAASPEAQSLESPTFLRRTGGSVEAAPQDADEEAALRAALLKAGVKEGPTMDRAIAEQMGRVVEKSGDVAKEIAKDQATDGLKQVGEKTVGGVNLPPDVEEAISNARVQRMATQQGATKGQMASRSSGVKSGALRGKYAGLDDDALKQEITQTLQRTDQAAQLKLEMLAEEASKRGLMAP